LQALAARGRSPGERLRVTEAELSVKTSALEQVERKLANGKAELNGLLALIEARDKLTESESRHTASAAKLRAENAALEAQLGQSYDEITKLEHEMTGLKRQVEAAWASERMANAVLRERINDVAGEVVRVAHALEATGSPIDTMLAGKATELDALTSGLKRQWHRSDLADGQWRRRQQGLAGAAHPVHAEARGACASAGET
jgi:chromosome segregation ATPase